MSTLAARLAATRLHRPRSANAEPIAPAAHGSIMRLFARFREWRRDARSRAELARMSMRELRDIGITPTERDRECDKRIWTL